MVSKSEAYDESKYPLKSGTKSMKVSSFAIGENERERIHYERKRGCTLFKGGGDVPKEPRLDGRSGVFRHYAIKVMG